VDANRSVIDAKQLRKRYGARLALDSISLEVKEGEVAGLLGPNGAGKTTTLSVLATLLVPDAGTVHIAGLDARIHQAAIRRRLGFVPQSIALYPTLSAAQNLDLFLHAHGIRGAPAHRARVRALELVGLADRAGDAVAILSGGMKRRLNLACGISHRPEVLLLDEPTIGVDLQSREHILSTIRDLADAGAAVIYSTHYMEEVERLCDRVFLIDRGKVVAFGSVAEVIAAAGGRPQVEFTFAGKTSSTWYEDVDGLEVLPPAMTRGRVTLRLASLDVVPELLSRARLVDGGLRDFSIHSPNLSDAFMALTGHALRDADPG
jgi:ABC-2 type transport system ATP-binding protein